MTTFISNLLKAIPHSFYSFFSEKEQTEQKDKIDWQQGKV